MRKRIQVSKNCVRCAGLAIIALLLVSACQESEEKGENTGPDTSTPGPMAPGDLDTNSDGRLTDDDLEPGQAAIHLIYTPPEEGAESFPVRFITTEAYIYYDVTDLVCPNPGWGLKIPIEHEDIAEDFAVFLWFHDNNLEVANMAVGQSKPFFLSVDIPAIEHGGQVEGPFEESITITQATEAKTSGWYSADHKISVAFYAPNAETSGEQFRILNIAFHNVTTVTELTDTCFRTPSECDFLVGDTCFNIMEEACAFAGCGDGPCYASESLPSKIFCE